MAKIPEGSLIQQFLPADYSDVYTYRVKADMLSADDIQVAFWTDSPKWIETLFRIRNSIVSLVGLEGGKRDTKDQGLVERVQEFLLEKSLRI